MTTLQLPAPAKLNLFLHINGRRPDGYHRLQTCFQLLDHGDELELSDECDDTLTLQTIGDNEIDTENNLVLRAARALQRHAGTTAGAHIRLHKRIPAGGGLGGGSSDAATALLALNRLWDLGLDSKTLAKIGLTLGADVPFFVHGRSAFAQGVGEELFAVELPAAHYLVVHPGITVSTARVFNAPELTRDTPESTVAAFLGAGSGMSFHNDCEPVARTLFPEINAALDWLSQQTGNARMTGTGACVFARIARPGEGERLLARLPSGWTGFVAEGRNVSPLHEALRRSKRESGTTG